MSERFIINTAKKMRKVALYVMFLVAVGLFFSCNKELKETTKVAFYPGVDSSYNTQNYLRFTGGTINIVSFEFDGTRKKGKDVYFEKEYPGGNLGYLENGVWSTPMSFDIFQGEYDRIEIEVETEGNTTSPAITVNGIYTDLSSTDIPVRLEFPSGVVYSITAKPVFGTDDILLKEGTASFGYINMKPQYWFDIVPRNDFENATLYNYNGEMTILITDSNNEDIYDLVVDRIDDKAEVIIR